MFFNFMDLDVVLKSLFNDGESDEVMVLKDGTSAPCSLSCCCTYSYATYNG